MPSSPTSTRTPTAAPASGIYGNPISFVGLANTNISPGLSVFAYSNRLRVPRSGNLVAVRKSFVWGPGYSAGDGGTITYQLQTDNGVATQHFPTGQILGQSAPFRPEDTNGFPLVNLLAPVPVSAGQYLHLVLLNSSADPVANYVSPDDVYDGLDETALAPARPPGVDPWDLGVLLNEGSWSNTVDKRDHYLPIVELVYQDGTSFGMGYMEEGSTAAGGGDAGLRAIDGVNAVREVFTVSGASRTATTLRMRVLRTSGTGGLKATLTSGSQTLFSVTTPAGQIPLGGKNSGQGTATDADWMVFPIPATALSSGQTYQLTFTTTAGTTYLAQTVRDGAATPQSEFGAGTVFADGYAQYTTGGAWLNWDTWGWSNVPGDQDLEFLFAVN
jgi:hypothetical protein